MPAASSRTPEAEVSDRIARVYKARYGRGPTVITTSLLRDAVVCLLRGVNTPTQASLVRLDRVDVAQAVHGELQMGMAQEMQEIVEDVTGRTVDVYVPGFNARADATTDTFFLRPQPQTAPTGD